VVFWLRSLRNCYLIVLGQKGPEQFRTLREQSFDKLYDKLNDSDENEIDGTQRRASHQGDYFHDGVNVLDIVSSWHNHL
jgi:hypothetical protein